MDLSEFDEAAMCVKDLISEYQQYQEMHHDKDIEDIDDDEDLDMKSAGEVSTRPQTAMSEKTPSR